MTNKYLQFIEVCKTKNYSKEDYLETHHIIPKHDGGFDTKENLIDLSFKDHIQAHLLRWEVYNQIGDLAAYNLMSGFDSEGWRLLKIEGAKATHQLLKSEKRNFWSSNFQKEMSKRSINSEYAMTMRSVGGKIGGHNRNKNIAIRKIDKYIFSYENKPTICIINCETGGEVLKELQILKPNNKFKRVTYLLNGKRKSLYNWSCQKV